MTVCSPPFTFRAQRGVGADEKSSSRYTDTAGRRGHSPESASQSSRTREASRDRNRSTRAALDYQAEAASPRRAEGRGGGGRPGRETVDSALNDPRKKKPRHDKDDDGRNPDRSLMLEERAAFDGPERGRPIASRYVGPGADGGRDRDRGSRAGVFDDGQGWRSRDDADYPPWRERAGAGRGRGGRGDIPALGGRGRGGGREFRSPRGREGSPAAAFESGWEGEWGRGGGRGRGGRSSGRGGGRDIREGPGRFEFDDDRSGRGRTLERGPVGRRGDIRFREDELSIHSEGVSKGDWEDDRRRRPPPAELLPPEWDHDARSRGRGRGGGRDGTGQYGSQREGGGWDRDGEEWRRRGPPHVDGDGFREWSAFDDSPPRAGPERGQMRPEPQHPGRGPPPPRGGGLERRGPAGLGMDPTDRRMPPPDLHGGIEADPRGRRPQVGWTAPFEQLLM